MYPAVHLVVVTGITQLVSGLGELVVGPLAAIGEHIHHVFARGALVVHVVRQVALWTAELQK